MQPVSFDWICPSFVEGLFYALCRDEAGTLWLCSMTDEKKGWQPVKEATDMEIEAMRWCQRLAGKDTEKIPL